MTSKDMVVALLITAAVTTTVQVAARLLIQYNS